MQLARSVLCLAMPLTARATVLQPTALSIYIYSGRSRLRTQDHANNQHQSVTANYTEHTNILCGQGGQILNFTTDGTQAYLWDLNV
jgi:hypothetical protein